MDRLRSYDLVVDGVKVDSVANGGEVLVSVEPGRHRLQMTIDWCTSPERVVHFQAGGVVEFECGPNAHPLLALLYISVWRHNYVRFERVSPSSKGRLASESRGDTP